VVRKAVRPLILLYGESKTVPTKRLQKQRTGCLIALTFLLFPCTVTAQPVTTHPRLLVTESDLPRLRTWAVPSNPIYRAGLARLADSAKQDMDRGFVPTRDNGGTSWDQYPSEMYAQLFAFMSLVSSDPDVQADYGQRARTCLMYAINLAARGVNRGKPFQDATFSTSDRSRWYGSGFALTVDWIYPLLSSEDKATIRQVFKRWVMEDMNATTTNNGHPAPVGVVDDPALVSDRQRVRWAGNNYYTAHMRNIGLMAMALDEADDPDNSLRDSLRNATGAWLYVIESLTRTDGAGGLFPEGFEYSPQTLGYVAQFLLALSTAGQDDPQVRGPQVALADSPFWQDVLSAFHHSMSPAPITNRDFGQVYQPAWYGDGQTYVAPDFISLFGPLALLDQRKGRPDRANSIRWIEKNLAPGGLDGLNGRVRDSNFFLNSILYFMLLDPDAPDSDDPRPNLPLTFFAPGMGRLLARTSWDADASWFTYKLSWSGVDHQTGDGNQFEFYRKGEWLTKERSGYDLDHGSSFNHNSLTIENDRPFHSDPSDYRYIAWTFGSQWPYVASGDPTIVARSFTEQFIHVSGDATPLYNSTSEGSTSIRHASRSIVWLKPDYIVVYDRATSVLPGKFKRFWLNLPAAASVSGNLATVTTASGQNLFVSTLLPLNAAIEGTTAQIVAGNVADFEPMKFRLRVEAPGGPQDVRFLHVLQGSDAGQALSPAMLVQSVSGTPFEGAAIAGNVVLFPVDLNAPFTTMTFISPTGTTGNRITGLTPNAGYSISLQPDPAGTRVTVTAGGMDYFADAGGVLEF